MIFDPIMPDDVRYNPATGCFEAKVTVHSAGPSRAYACEVAGDLSRDIDDVIRALKADAYQRCTLPSSLSSARRSTEPLPRHTPCQPKRPWLSRVPLTAYLQNA